MLMLVREFEIHLIRIGAFEMFHTCKRIKWLNLTEFFTMIRPTYLFTAQCSLHLLQEHLHGKKHDYSYTMNVKMCATYRCSIKLDLLFTLILNLG